MIAFVFAAIAAVSIAGGTRLATLGATASALAILVVIPFGLVAGTAAAFVIAPLSRFGRWLDLFLPSLAGWCGVAVVIALWAMSLLVFVTSSRV